jgi:hypothetical protein
MNATLSRGGRYCGDFEIARIEMPSAAEFERNYARVGKPVILTSWLGRTAAARKWSPEYLVRAVGRQPTIVTRLRGGKLRSDNTRYVASFADYATRAFGGDPVARRFCVQQIDVPAAIARDLPTPRIVGSWLRQKPRLWLSTPGHVTETHRDENHNLLAQVLGRKRLTLFSPVFAPALYSHRPGRLGRYSRVDLERPDLDRFPEARELTPTQVVLEPGEALFLPVHWWHRVETLETSVSVNFWWAPPLNLLLHPQWSRTGGTPGELFATVHALADLSTFASELDVVECLRREGFDRLAATYLCHCLAILAAPSDREAVAAHARSAAQSTAHSLRSIRRDCRRAVERLAGSRRHVLDEGTEEIGSLVDRARRLAARLGRAGRLRPSRWLRPPGLAVLPP